MVAAAVIGGAVIGAGASMASGGMAANAQENAASQATNAQLSMFNTARGDLSPFVSAGLAGKNQLMGLMNGSPEQVQAALEALPGYQFTRNQGLQAVQNSAAARGLGVSGASMRGAADYATGLADQTYGNQFNRLFNVMSAGQNAAAQTGTFGMQTGQEIGQNMIGAGNAQAAMYMNAGNAVGGAANGVGQYYMMNSLLNSGGYSGLYGSTMGGGYGGSFDAIPAGSPFSPDYTGSYFG